MGLLNSAHEHDSSSSWLDFLFWDPLGLGETAVIVIIVVVGPLYIFFTVSCIFFVPLRLK